MVKVTTPRQFSLVKFIPPKGYEEVYAKQGLWPYPNVYVFMGEIPNMRGHCIVILHKPNPYHQTPPLLVGYHTDDFVELNEEEV